MAENSFRTFHEETEKALKSIEERIAQLSTRWKLFFMGSKEQRYPPELETEKLAHDIRNLPSKVIMRASHQFLYSNLGYRFNMLRERWNQFMRILEEKGPEAVLDAMGVHNPKIRRQALRGPQHRPVPQPSPAVNGNLDPYESVYRQYTKAIQQVRGNVAVDRERFLQELKKQETLIREKFGDVDLEFSVRVDHGKPKIKARVKKPSIAR